MSHYLDGLGRHTIDCGADMLNAGAGCTCWPGEPPTIVIQVNRNVTMTPGKLAAQAVHAALMLHGIEHGSVVVLKASKGAVETCTVQVRDAGLTEVDPGTLTCGASFREVSP